MPDICPVTFTASEGHSHEVGFPLWSHLNLTFLFRSHTQVLGVTNTSTSVKVTVHPVAVSIFTKSNFLRLCSSQVAEEQTGLASGRTGIL